jgi:uncharacterized membrane protein YqiK
MMELGLIAVILVLVLVFIVFKMSGMVRYVPNNRCAVVERLWSSKGSLTGGVIALDGEAGFLPDVLRGGIHFFKPFTYRLWIHPIVTVGANEIGYVFARSGAVLPASQSLASNAVAHDFQDVRAFLQQGGQKGPQRAILRGGVHPLNSAQFVVVCKEQIFALNLDPTEQAMLQSTQALLADIKGFDPVVIDGDKDQIGVVTTLDGPTLGSGELIAPIVGADPADAQTYHHAFQDAEAFLRGGGFRGRQYQPLSEGSYYINRLFATVELRPKTVIKVGHVGVVVSNIGREQPIEANSVNKHGDLVGEGYKGVRARSLSPGKYAFNPYAGYIEEIQTTNIILRFEEGAISTHKLDANLKEIQLITKDAFEPILPLSVVLHIDVQKAAKVVQRFGNLPQLVNETIDPLVASWFKNTAQQRGIIELIQARDEVQKLAMDEMKVKFSAFDIELVDVLIGTPRGEGIERILQQLRDRQIAKEQVDTYRAQKDAADQQRTLNDAQAQAEAQGGITRSKVGIEVAENEGQAKVKRAQQEAQQITVLAEANARAAKLQGEGEGGRLASIGAGEAAAVEAKVKASGGANFQMVTAIMGRMADAIEKGKLPIVPQTLITSGEGAQSGNALVQLLEALLSNQLPKLPQEAVVEAPQA